MYRILIADDEGLMLEAFKGVILAEFGDKCSVETAKTGRAVIEKAETFHPDIVFMDIHMPGINGIQAMREIRKFNNIPYQSCGSRQNFEKFNFIQVISFILNFLSKSMNS